MFKQVFSMYTQFGKDLYDILKIAQENTLIRLREMLILTAKKQVYENESFENFWSLHHHQKQSSAYQDKSWGKKTKITNKYYNRTYTFTDVDFWKISKPYVKGGVVRGNIQPNSSYDLKYDSTLWRHTSPDFMQKSGYSNFDLDAYGLVKVINNGLPRQKSIVGEIPARPFWDKFVDMCYKTGGLYEAYFKQELYKLTHNGQKIVLGAGSKYNITRSSESYYGFNDNLHSYLSNVNSIIHKTDLYIAIHNQYLIPDINFRYTNYPITIGESVDTVGGSTDK